MASSPELEKQPQPNVETVREIPQEVELSPSVTSQGVTATQSQFKAQVTDDTGAPLIQTSQSDAPVITIAVPRQQIVLEDTVKRGSVDDSATWNAFYFLRSIKKALHFGWKVIFGGST